MSRYVGDLLAQHGVAVLVTDKRGTGASTGQWYGLSHEDWATDVEAMLDFLGEQPDVDPSRLGLFGNSEGGFVVPVVTARRPDVRFLVCRVCSAFPQPVTIAATERSRLLRSDLPEEEVELAMELLERLMDYALTRSGYEALVAHSESGAGRPWRGAMPPASIPAPESSYWDTYRANLIVDPAEHYGRLHVPTLVVLGQEDERIVIEQHRPVLDSLAAAGAPLEVWVIPGASHGLMEDPGSGLRYPPGMHDRVVEWVVEAARVR
jgi:pimeloyl-ACP methyl ester carboxylesterase